MYTYTRTSVSRCFWKRSAKAVTPSCSCTPVALPGSISAGYLVVAVVAAEVVVVVMCSEVERGGE